MLKSLKRRLASRALAIAAREYTAARDNFAMPLGEAIARMTAAQAAMNRASRRLLELSR